MEQGYHPKIGDCQIDGDAIGYGDNQETAQSIGDVTIDIGEDVDPRFRDVRMPQNLHTVDLASDDNRREPVAEIGMEGHLGVGPGHTPTLRHTQIAGCS